MAVVAAAALAALATASTGCGPTDAGKSVDSRPAERKQVSDESWQPVEEFWEAVYQQGGKVGHVHTTISEQGKEVRVAVDVQLQLKRYGQTIRQQIAYSSVETKTGDLVAFESSIQGSGVDLRSRGRVEGGKLLATTTTVGKESPETVPWQAGWGGFYHVEGSLRRQPMQPGEQRRVTGVTPMSVRPSETVLNATSREEVLLPAGPRELLRIEATQTLAGNPIESTLWTDDEGRIWKTALPAMEQTSLRVDRETALAEGDEASLPDIGLESLARLDRPLPGGHQARRAVYRATLKNGDPAQAFVDSPTQKVRAAGANSVTIAVEPIRPEQAAPPASETPPSDDDRSPNNFIQSDDRRIVQLAQSSVPAGSDEAAAAVALESMVRQMVTRKSYSRSFSTAIETLESREGDCTEHAVLLAALLRARGIPARVALGLVYLEGEQAFGFHMWTEAWIRGRWVDLDAMLGRGGIGAGHIKVARTSLAGGDALTALLPVAKLMGRLELELLEPN